MRELTPEPLTAEAFAPFGDVIEPSDRAEQLAINYGMTTRFNDLATLDIGEDHGRPIVSIFRGRLLAPLVLRIFERHPLGSQAFVPLSGRPFLAAVAIALLENSRANSFAFWRNSAVRTAELIGIRPVRLPAVGAPSQPVASEIHREAN